MFAESEDQPHRVEAMDGVLRRLGGNARRWRTDRMATVVDPATGVVQPSFVPVAKHYGVSVVACPPRRGNRKGSVEKSIHFATQRFWRTMAAVTMAEAQSQLDRFCERIGDRRPRPLAKLEQLIGTEAATRLLAERRRDRPSVADLAGLERLWPLPAACYPATIEAANHVGPSALVPFEGNAYSVPHALIGAEVSIRHRLGSGRVEIVSRNGILVAGHASWVGAAGHTSMSRYYGLVSCSDPGFTRVDTVWTDLKGTSTTPGLGASGAPAAVAAGDATPRGTHQFWSELPTPIGSIDSIWQHDSTVLDLSTPTCPGTTTPALLPIWDEMLIGAGGLSGSPPATIC